MSKSSSARIGKAQVFAMARLYDVMSMMCNRRSSNVGCNDNVRNGDETCIDGGGITAAIRRCADTERCQFDNDCESGLCHHKVKRVIGGIASFGDPSAPDKFNENDFAALQDGGYGGEFIENEVMEMDTATETASLKPATRQQL